jgi:hypothetical protein
VTRQAGWSPLLLALQMHVRLLRTAARPAGHGCQAIQALAAKAGEQVQGTGHTVPLPAGRTGWLQAVASPSLQLPTLQAVTNVIICSPFG